MKKIEHIGIAVQSLEKAEKLYGTLLGKPPYKRETVASENVITSFFRIGETKIELLVPANENSPIAKFLEKKGEGIHHIAFEVDNIYEEIKRLEKEGFDIIYTEPKKGADNKLVTFIHPKTTGGILIELCQEIK